MSDITCPACGHEGEYGDFQDQEDMAPDLANAADCPNCGHFFEIDSE